MRFLASFVGLLSGSLAMSLACTATTPGEDLPGGTDGDPAGTGAPAGSAPTSGEGPGAVPKPDTRGVVSVGVTASSFLGSVNPIDGVQETGTNVRIVLRDRDVEDVLPTGTLGTCVEKSKVPVDADAEHDLDFPMSVTVRAAGQVQQAAYHPAQRYASAAFYPALPNGTPITVVFGPEVPALAGKSVALAAVTTTLAAPSTKPWSGVLELRAYTPGTDLELAWAAVAGRKVFLGVGAEATPQSEVECFPTETATSLSVPAKTMEVMTSGVDPTKQFPLAMLLSRVDASEEIGGIRVRTASSATLAFHLNLNP